MELKFALWIAVVVLFKKSTCVSSNIDPVASERRSIDSESPSDYNDEENSEKIIENELLFGTSLQDFPVTDTTLHSSSTNDIPKITWNLVSLLKNSTSQLMRDDVPTTSRSKTKASSPSTTRMPLNLNSSTFQDFSSSFPHVLDSSDNELDSDVSDTSTEHIPHRDSIFTEESPSSLNDMTTPYPTTELSTYFDENVAGLFPSEVTTSFENEISDDTNTKENTFRDVDHSKSFLDYVSNSSDYLNTTSNEDLTNNANVSYEDDYITFIPLTDLTTDDFPSSENDLDGIGISEENNSVVTSSLNLFNSLSKFPFTSRVTLTALLTETTSPSLIPNDLFVQKLMTPSSEKVQHNTNEFIGANSEFTTLPPNYTETSFPQANGFDFTDSNFSPGQFNTLQVNSSGEMHAFNDEATEHAVDSDNDLVPPGARTETGFASSVTAPPPEKMNYDKGLDATQAVSIAADPTDPIPVHPLITLINDATTKQPSNNTRFSKEDMNDSVGMLSTIVSEESNTLPYSSFAHADAASKKAEKIATLPPENITSSFDNEIQGDLSNVATYVDGHAFEFETSTYSDITTTTLSKISIKDDATPNTVVIELFTHDDQITTGILNDRTKHDDTIPAFTTSEFLTTTKSQDIAVINDKELDNKLFYSSREYFSTTENIFIQSPPSPHNTDDSETRSEIPPETTEFLQVEIHTSEKVGDESDAQDPELRPMTTPSALQEVSDVQDVETAVSSKVIESATITNSGDPTVTFLKENASFALDSEKGMSSSQATETHREGKHIPFSTTRTVYERKPSKPTVPASVSSDFETTKNEVGVLYNQIKSEDLTPDEKGNVVTAIIQTHPLHYEREEINEKIIIAHLWLLHAIVEGYKNNSMNSTSALKSAVAFENLPQISYILPTPKIHVPNITLSFIAQHVGQNDSIPAELLLNILNMRKEDLKVLANVKNVKFFHGLPTEKYDFLTAIVEKYGIIVLVTCVTAVGMIILLICVVVYYRRKARHSAHCLTDDKLHRNMQEAMGIDLNPAVIILQDEMREKTVLNGNKICSIDDDEGWLAPIDDVPMPEETNGPCIQDTKL